MLNKFFILKQDINDKSSFKINSYLSTTEDDSWNKDEIVFFCSEVYLDRDAFYHVEMLQLPYKYRSKIISSCRQSVLLDVPGALFEKYVSIATTINGMLKTVYDNIYVFCSALYTDFCILIPKDIQMNLDVESLKKNILNFVRLCIGFDDEDSHQQSVEYLYELRHILKNKIERDSCIGSGRQFVKYNPMFYDYCFLMNKIENINCDKNIDRIQELSLFSGLVLKDLVEETHLYWMNESGDLHYANAEKTYLLKKQNKRYFDCFERFCEQAKDSHKYNDWCWAIIFLTQTLLATLQKRQTSECNSQTEIDDYINFYGFVPIITDLKEKKNEVASFFTRHISRKFCHSFLIVPKSSIEKILENLPAYIHEFFHYIPPANRKERNESTMKLLVHSLLFDLRRTLSATAYRAFFDSFLKKLETYMLRSGFREEIFYSCDSMEFIERVQFVLTENSFVALYDYATTNISDVNGYLKAQIVRDNCIGRFKDSFYLSLIVLVLFFREIRSDIAMCDFFGLELKDYIKIMANEPLFAVLNEQRVGDSTIMRFGYMCNYLAKKTVKDAFDWKKVSSNIINEEIAACKIEIENNTNSKKQKEHYENMVSIYSNLLGYINEYSELAYETEANQYTPKGNTLIDEYVNNLVEEWEKYNQRFSEHDFTVFLKGIYKKYLHSSKEERLKLVCGSKILFRDLYTYDSNLDKR